MNLDNKVAVITEKMTDKAKTFDYWLRLSTFEKGNPVHMPVQSNKYFDGFAGNRRKFCQANLNDKHEISISFIKDVPAHKKNYDPATDKTCLTSRVKLGKMLRTC
jgi:putative transposase